MTATLALERIPRPVATLLDEGAANLATVANELDALVHGDASALDAIARAEDNGDRIVHDLIGSVGHSWRVGPDRARLLLLAQAIDDVVDALHALAWSWPQAPLPELADVLLAVRDLARDSDHRRGDRGRHRPARLAGSLPRARGRRPTAQPRRTGLAAGRAERCAASDPRPRRRARRRRGAGRLHAAARPPGRVCLEIARD